MKKILVLIVTALLCLSLAGCTVEFTESQYNSDEFIATHDISSAKMSVMSTRNDNEVNYSANEFNGVKTIWTGKITKGGAAAVNLKFGLGVGKAKLVLVDSNGNVTTIAEVTPETEIERSTDFVVTLTNGKNKLKLVGCNIEDVQTEIEIRF
ncbi:MAG: hypothetical protein ACI4QY_05615 [Oscillospiraceae bacterium]